MTFRQYIAIAASIIATSCTESPLMPTSGGDPYEVVLIADDDGAREIVKGILKAPLEGMPQPEPMFDVSTVDGSDLTQATRYAKTIVRVRIDAEQYTQTRVKYERDTYAHPQLIVSVNTPSATTLRSDSARVATLIRRLIDAFEMNAIATALDKRHNVEAGKTMKKMFGYEISIPQEMTYTKTGKDFFWVSDNGATSMSSICVYAIDGIHIAPDEIIRLRDSVMARNIPGEQPGMKMATEKRLPPTFRPTDNRREKIETRGLWQMEGDAMGGPFVSHTIVDSIRHRTITAEGFVYAPGKTKRDRLKRTEAALYTLKRATDNGNDKKK